MDTVTVMDMVTVTVMEKNMDMGNLRRSLTLIKRDTVTDISMRTVMDTSTMIMEAADLLGMSMSMIMIDVRFRPLILQKQMLQFTLEAKIMK